MAAVTAFLLVGGMGSRLRSVVSEVPKALAPIAGRPFLEYLLDYLLAEGVNGVVLCIGFRGHMVESWFGPEYRGLQLRYSDERVALGTGGALAKALREFNPPELFFVLNGDTFFPINLETFAEGSDAGLWQWKLALFEAHDSARYGRVVLDSDQRVTSLLQPREGRMLPAVTPFLGNSGIWLCNSSALGDLLFSLSPPFSLEDFISLNVSTLGATVIGQVFDAPFIDIGLPRDYRRAQEIFRSR